MAQRSDELSVDHVATVRQREKGLGWLRFVVFLAILGLAGFVRFEGLGSEDYWLDELHSLGDSAGHRREMEEIPHGVILHELPRYTDLTPESGWRTTWRTMEDDSHPPLYFLMLVSWRQMWGDGEFAVRSLTALVSILSIVPVFLTARAYGREGAGMWMALVLALAFGHVHTGREARPYALAILWVSISYWLFARFEQERAGTARGRRLLQWVAYAGSIYLTAMTHYFAVLPLLGQGAYALVRRSGRLLRFWGSAVLAAAVVWAVTWGRQFLGQLAFIGQQDWLREYRGDHAARTWMRLADLPVRLLFNHDLFVFDGTRILLGGVVLTGVLWLSYRYRRGPVLLFSAWFFVPVLAYLIIDLASEHQLLTYLRYASLAVGGLVGSIALGLDALPVRVGWGAVVLLLASMALAPDQPSQHNPLSRQTARLVEQEIRPGDLLIYDAADWPRFWAARLYLLISQYLRPPSPAFVLLRSTAPAELLDEYRRYDRLIVVSPPEKGVPNPLPDQFEHRFSSDYIFGIGNVHVFERIRHGVGVGPTSACTSIGA